MGEAEQTVEPWGLGSRGGPWYLALGDLVQANSVWDYRSLINRDEWECGSGLVGSHTKVSLIPQIKLFALSRS